MPPYKQSVDETTSLIVLACCVAALVSISLYRIFNRQKGTWSNQVMYDPLWGFTDKPRRRQGARARKTNVPVKPKKSQCSDSSGETECRRVLEAYFKKPFKKIRPMFLRNPIQTGRNLELDCYNDELKLAVEYNGIQHYKFCNYFHKSYEHFKTQQYRDVIKQNMCAQNGIVLIEVPYTVKIKDIEAYILDELARKNFLEKSSQKRF
jgi:hypothetical protein